MAARPCPARSPGAHPPARVHGHNSRGGDDPPGPFSRLYRRSRAMIIEVQNMLQGRNHHLHLHFPLSYGSVTPQSASRMQIRRLVTLLRLRRYRRHRTGSRHLPLLRFSRETVSGIPPGSNGCVIGIPCNYTRQLTDFPQRSRALRHGLESTRRIY